MVFGLAPRQEWTAPQPGQLVLVDMPDMMHRASVGNLQF